MLAYGNCQTEATRILQDSGKVSAEYAKEFAESEFEKYRIIQDRLFQSDFDRFEDNSLPALDIE